MSRDADAALTLDRTVNSNGSYVGLFGLGLLGVDAAPSFAGNCGGHCQVMKRCGELVREKGVKGADFRNEFNECMTDSANHK